MSKNSGVFAISISTSIVTSAIMFVGLQFLLVPKLKKASEPVKSTEVPKLIGLRPDDAKIILKQKGLLLSISKYSSHPTIAKGLIHTQKPLPSSLIKKGQTVSVEISSGISKVKVPMLVGMSKDAAVKKLTGLKLGYSIKFREDQNGKADMVLSQNPKPGESVVPDSQVNLVISKVPTKLLVPKYAKTIFKRKKIKEELEKLGLKIGKVYHVDWSDVADGYIYSTDPKEGTEVKPGTAINFKIQRAEDD